MGLAPWGRARSRLPVTWGVSHGRYIHSLFLSPGPLQRSRGLPRLCRRPHHLGVAPAARGSVAFAGMPVRAVQFTGWRFPAGPCRPHPGLAVRRPHRSGVRRLEVWPAGHCLPALGGQGPAPGWGLRRRCTQCAPHRLAVRRSQLAIIIGPPSLGGLPLGVIMSWQLQHPWSFLPAHARDQATRLFPRSRRPIGNGDGWLYRYAIQTPPPGYCGPMPFCVLYGRVRG